MAMRSSQDGWKLIQFGDVIAQRRGIWLRLTETHVEICGGREGDDLQMQIPLHGPDARELPTAEDWKSLYQQAEWHYDSCIDDLLQMKDEKLLSIVREWLGAVKAQLGEA